MSFKCQGCGHINNGIPIRKPKLLTPTVSTFECSNCESKMIVHLIKRPEHARDQCESKPFKIQPSAKLLKMMKEAREKAALEQQQIEAKLKAEGIQV